MSAHLSREDVLFHQRLLRQDGLYMDGELDGLWGPKTMAADDERGDLLEELMAAEGSYVKPRSRALVVTLAIAGARLALRLHDELVRRLSSAFPRPEIISATRSWSAQGALFRQGRYGNAGPRVTNARAGQSWHNYGLAFDVGLFRADGSYIREEGPYREAGEWLMDQGIEGLAWGGHWKSFKDWPHYQLSVPWGITEMRRRFEAGIPLEGR